MSGEPIEIAFIQVETDTWWADLDWDGRQDAGEKLVLKADDDKDAKFEEFVRQNSTTFWSFQSYKPTFLSTSLEDYFDHPERTKFQQQIDRDIEQLKAMENRPEIYTRLLADLEAIQEELRYTRFEFATEGEVPEGFIGVYDPFSAMMLVNQGAPASLLVHEMDHGVTTHQRVAEYSISYKVMVEEGVVHEIPRDSTKAEPTPENISFSFKIDFPKSGPQELTYDDLAAFQPLIQTLEHGELACTTPESRAAALANEVRGYLTMSRYLLFRVGFNQEQIDLITSEDELEASAAKELLLQSLISHLGETNLNPRWAHQLLLYYFGLGGDTGQGNLVVFVNSYYTSQQAPGFADAPGCKKFE